MLVIVLKGDAYFRRGSFYLHTEQLTFCDGINFFFFSLLKAGFCDFNWNRLRNVFLFLGGIFG